MSKVKPISLAAAESYVSSFVNTGRSVLPPWWKDHVLLRRTKTRCVFCRNKVLSDIVPTIFYRHVPSITGDYDMREGNFDLPICAVCDSILKEEERLMEMNEINVLSQKENRTMLYLEELDKDQLSRLNSFVTSGLIPDVQDHLFKGDMRFSCIICKELPGTEGIKKKVYSDYNFELLHVPVGQSSRITEQVVICTSCSNAGGFIVENFIKEEKETDIDIKAEVCITCEEDYFVTVLEYNQRLEQGSLGQHSCMECLASYVGSTRIVPKADCRTCRTAVRTSHRSFDITWKKHEKISQLYLEYNDFDTSFSVDHLCEKMDFPCELNIFTSADIGNQIGEPPKIYRMEDKDRPKGTKALSLRDKIRKKNIEEKEFIPQLLDNVWFNVDDLPVVVKLEKVTCKRYDEVWTYKVVAGTNSEYHSPNTILSEFSSQPHLCIKEGNGERNLCKCFDTQLGANVACATILETFKEKIK